MFALYEDAGKFHAGRVLADGEASAQIELASGKRAKVKAAHVLLRFAAPEPDALLMQATALADEIDLDLAWSSAPDDEFAFGELARDYFGAATGAPEQAATLIRLYGAPHYFRRLGRGRFRKASEEVVKAALVGIERKRQAALQVDAWAEALVAGACPEPVREQLFRILFKPDKNAVEYKAVVQAARQSGRAPLELLRAAGAIESPYEFHWRRFLFERFPKGTAFPALDAAPAADGEIDALPLGSARAFSIDDSSTTEIDDALSVEGLGTPEVTVGVHIAAPALALRPGSPIDAIARQRLTTVYIPGHKLTMLPPAVVDAYSLAAGAPRPVLSLYVRVDATTLAVRSRETRLERLAIAANLRHDAIDDGTAGDPSAAPRWPAEIGFASELDFLHRFALALKAGREHVRGKPETFNRPDYTFALERSVDAPIRGDEPVTIVERRRGSPLDLIVAEAMILANASWGAWLAECATPGIYRSQASLAPGIKVRMGTKAAPHAGLGVAHYAWSTSPLRRYVDLVNQWQLVACVRHGRTAALAAPFRANDAALYAIVADFESAYADANAFQTSIERYWTLTYLAQNGIRELDAVVLANGLVRATTLPLVVRAVGADAHPRGTRVRIAVGAADLVSLDLHASVVGRIDAAAPVAAGADDDGDGDDAAGPLAIAIDVQADTDPAPEPERDAAPA